MKKKLKIISYFSFKIIYPKETKNNKYRNF